MYSALPTIMSSENKNDSNHQPHLVSDALYVRRKNLVKGPYPRGLIRNFVLIGRLQLEDEVSSDKEYWYRIKEDKNLIPKEMISVESSVDKEHLSRAQRRQDERANDRREQGTFAGSNERRANDRREDESKEMKRHRQQLSSLHRAARKRKFSFFSIVVFSAIISGLSYLVMLALDRGAPAVAVAINCKDKSAPGVNWKNCNLKGMVAVSANLQGASLQNVNMSGADIHASDLSNAKFYYANLSKANLSYSDLTNAKLVGAILANADLSNSNLTNADLSYANLKGAKLGGANLKGAKLERTIWIDGTICRQGSVGFCRK